jgi:hypothetical protein
MVTEPSVWKTPVAVSHLVGFFCNLILKSAYSTISLFTSDPEDPESMSPR